jgi:peptidoglycan/LPS O-acetylase OafA/YrhL
MKYIKYRPDIDGLRAVAILSVVTYHAFPTKISGGFIGVDIFFVISGFLISNILFKNLAANNFSYKEFYARRIKRIFPALLLVVLFNLLAGWYLLFPDEFKQLGKHIVGGSGFISNIILWVEAGYFDKASETKPLLHLWSLSVEEQFYIFWPILLGLFWRKKLNLLFIMLSIAIVSFFISIYTLNNFSSSAAFYLPFNRFWELMVGGVLAYIYTKQIITIKNSYVNIQALLGMILIVLALVLIDEYKQFPGAWVLLPTVGAFLLILSKDSLINNYILSNKILVYIGLVSYPLYLWHWSLLSFAHVLNMTERNDRIIVVLLSFLLSILTYEFLEKKVKNIRKITSILIIASVILTLFGASVFMGIISPRNNSSAVNLLAKAVMDWEYPEGLSPQYINEVKVFTAGNKKNKVLFYGDSHLQQYSPRIVKLLNDNPSVTKSVVFATRGGCPPIPNVFEDQRHPWCTTNYKNTIEKYAFTEEVDSVVIGFADSYFM